MTDENGKTAAYGLLKNPADFLLMVCGLYLNNNDKRQNGGRLEDWRIGRLEDWKIRGLETAPAGTAEDWKIGNGNNKSKRMDCHGGCTASQ